MLQIGSARAPDVTVFAETPAVIVLQAEQPWDEQAVRQTLTDAAGNLWTLAASARLDSTPRDGALWYSCDGPAHFHFAVSGSLLLLANSPDDLNQCWRGSPSPPVRTDAVYRSVFRHAQERGGYDRIMGMLDSVQTAAPDGAQATRWSFFSSDLASLSTVFARVSEVRVEIRDAGSGLREQVSYRTQ